MDFSTQCYSALAFYLYCSPRLETISSICISDNADVIVVDKTEKGKVQLNVSLKGHYVIFTILKLLIRAILRLIKVSTELNSYQHLSYLSTSINFSFSVICTKIIGTQSVLTQIVGNLLQLLVRLLFCLAANNVIPTQQLVYNL